MGHSRRDPYFSHIGTLSHFGEETVKSTSDYSKMYYCRISEDGRESTSYSSVGRLDDYGVT